MLASSYKIYPEGDKALTAGQELALLRAAYLRSPTSRLREGLLRLLMLDEAFTEVIETLGRSDPLDYRCEMMLAQAHLSLESADDDRAAAQAAERALALAATDIERAQALATRGKCETRLGQRGAARATFVEALALDPRNRDACKRIAALDLADGRADLLLTRLASLAAEGAAHARLYAAQALAHARLGNIAAAREANGHAEFLHSELLSPPAGWENLTDFNAALADELLSHPGIRYERYGSASALTWRIENPARPDRPAFKALFTSVTAMLERRLAAIAPGASPWARATPPSAVIRNWCVITDGDGFEGWHVHQFGWLSGVYYVQIPDAIAQGRGRAGCLAFGLPEDLAGEAGSAAFGEHLVRPLPGMLHTFPSQAYHRTYPHGSPGKRICIAFDLRPTPSAE